MGIDGTFWGFDRTFLGRSPISGYRSQTLSLKKNSRREKVGGCERVLRFMDREVQGRSNFRMQAVKWVVTKLQGDKAALQTVCRNGMRPP